MNLHINGCRFLTVAAVAAALLAAPAGCLYAREAKEAGESMIRIPSTTLTVGSTEAERAELGRQHDFHASWLADELPSGEVTLKEFWIDRFPVTNRQYAAYLRATGGSMPYGWDPARLDHPVVNITASQAMDYAEWAGKRLPSPEEWGCAFQGIVAEPGPLEMSPDWSIQTRPVADGAVAPSGAGGYGLVSELTTTMSGEEYGCRLVKGPSWLHQEPWSLRPQAAYYSVDNAPTKFIGFRCVADSNVPGRPELSQPLPEEWVTAAAEQPAPSYEEEHASLLNTGERYFAVHFGKPRGICYLFCPELVSVNGKTDVFIYDTPTTITWEEGEQGRMGRRAAYTMQGQQIRSKYVLEAGPDWVEIQYIFPNDGDETIVVNPSTCVGPSDTFSLFDVEGTRTYYWFGEGEWMRVRQVPRGIPARCLTYHAPPSIPEGPQVAVGAVVSHDGASVLGYAKEILGQKYSAHDNILGDCFHIDPAVEVPPGATRTVRSRVYYIEGDLDTLRERIVADFSL